jgi:hypothetical protein
MKTKFYWVALLASAAMIAQANAGGHHGGGGGGSVAPSGPSNSGRSGAVSSYRSMPTHTFGGGRVIYSGERFTPRGVRSSSSAAFRPHYVYSNAGVAIGARQFRPSNNHRGNNVARSSNGNRTSINARHTGVAQVKNGNGTLRADWHHHVFAQRSANWQRNWDRRSDHWWHGHRCHFFNGSWVIFDLGFYPWDTFWYPYDNYYYGNGYYPYSYGYDPGYYGPNVSEDEEYYDQNNYDVTVQSADSIVANAQEKLAQQGYYRGEIDGILGAETSRAIARFQSDQGLRVTGVLTRDTIQELGLRRVAIY